MNPEQELKIQAYLDGELSGAEAKQISELLAKDKDARVLFEELQMMKTALAGNEPEVKLPESREFFWSKIEREINRQEAKPARQEQPVSILAWLHRHLVPVSATAMLALIGFMAFNSSNSIGPVANNVSSTHIAEIESLNDEMGSISFRSESDQMTVIYLYDKDTESSEASDLQ